MNEFILYKYMLIIHNKYIINQFKLIPSQTDIFSNKLPF